MLINYEKALEKLQLVRDGQLKEGLRLGIPELDEHFRYKPSNFNIVLGHANVGKTSLILYLMLAYSVKHDLKWLIFSSENESYSILRKLVEYLDHKPINKVEQKDFDRHTAWIYKRFKIVDSEKMYTYNELLQLLDVVKNAWDYDGVLVDPYNSLIKDHKLIKALGGHDYDYQACTEMRIFCKKRNVSIWVNTHANTEALRKLHRIDHEYAGHPIPPMAADVEGGGKFVNRADDFMVIHRYTQHPSDFMYSHLHVRKIKEIETGGRPTTLDNPIRFRSVINNVGFSIDGVNVIRSLQEKIT